MRMDWDTVYEKPVVEFLNILSYVRDRNELERQQMEEFKNKLKTRRKLYGHEYINDAGG